MQNRQQPKPMTNIQQQQLEQQQQQRCWWSRSMSRSALFQRLIFCSVLLFFFFRFAACKITAATTITTTTFWDRQQRQLNFEIRTTKMNVSYALWQHTLSRSLSLSFRCSLIATLRSSNMLLTVLNVAANAFLSFSSICLRIFHLLFTFYFHL